MQSAPFDLNAAWERLAEMIGWIVSLFGGPGEIAQRMSLLRKDRQHFLQWLAPLEALARRLLFIEAARLPAPNAAPAFVAAGRIVNSYTDRIQPVPSEDPRRWRVLFRIGLRTPGDAALPGVGAAQRTLPDRVHNALPLARRLEALLRLAENRAGAVKRLARRLHAHPQRSANAFAPYRHRTAFAEESLNEAQSQADLARTRFANTS